MPVLEEELIGTTGAMLGISNQKNWMRGSLIHQCALEGIYYPVKALVRRFIHMYINDAALSNYFYILGSPWDQAHNGQEHEAMYKKSGNQT